MNSLDDEFRYTADLVVLYKEGPEFMDWLLAFDVEDPCFRRGLQVREMVPQNFDLIAGHHEPIDELN